jgi:gamma-glutamyl hercynylcysteine S-oxide synthase
MLDFLNDAAVMRRADASQLAKGLQAARNHTLALYEAYRTELGDTLRVPLRAELNLPLWELGHIAWFQEWWLLRNPERCLGARANPNAPRSTSLLRGVDAIFNSSTVGHAERWQLALPGWDETLDYMAQVQQASLSALQTAGSTHEQLYFFRLCLFHEDMHAEAAGYMARNLGFVANPLKRRALLAKAQQIQIAAQTVCLGHHANGFAFDNELNTQSQRVAAFEIDAQPLSQAQYNQFCESVGRTITPRMLRDAHAGRAAAHMSWHDALACAQHLGRTLPTEAQWMAAHAHEGFAQGDVWEWTASDFAPFDGFAAHPYVDYSQPWFGGGYKVLKGGSAFTAPRMKHAQYRNFFLPHRSDVEVGFRTCSKP